MVGPSAKERSEKAKSTIVVRRVRRQKPGGHGAAWKIAYADFVTAMMAFFLLMWLLSSTTKGDLRSIERYFQTPLQTAINDGPGVGNANTIVTGGGEDYTRTLEKIRRREVEANHKRLSETRHQERLRMERMKAQLGEVIANSERLREFKDQLRVEITPDGLRIQIVDNQSRPMFDLGSARLKPYMRDILREFGRILNEANGRIVVTGHTDAIRYATGDAAYSNWELSLDRANASRRELIAGGMESNRFARVVGLAELNPLDRNNAGNPLDRRISIIVLNRLADEQMQKAGGEIEAGSAKDLTGFASSTAADPLAGGNASLDASATAAEPAP